LKAQERVSIYQEHEFRELPHSCGQGGILRLARVGIRVDFCEGIRTISVLRDEVKEGKGKWRSRATWCERCRPFQGRSDFLCEGDLTAPAIHRETSRVKTMVASDLHRHMVDE